MHLELITATVTAPGASGAAAVAAVGDSLVIKNSKGPARIIAAWSMQQADGWLQIIKPSGHDTTRGWRQVIDASTVMNQLPAGVALQVEPQELIGITIAGSAVAGDVDLAHLMMLYETLPGVTSRTIGWPDLKRRGDFSKLVTLQATLTGSAPGYTGTELITAESDLLQANRDYAVLGMTTNIPCGAIFLTGPDTGYQRVAAPGGITEADYGRDWFCALSRAFDEPLIPVINSGNRASTSIGFVQNENNISPQVSVALALLR